MVASRRPAFVRWQANRDADSGTLRLISLPRIPHHVRKPDSSAPWRSWKAAARLYGLPVRADVPQLRYTFCQQTEFADGRASYRRIPDLIWETLTVKDAKVNFDSQLENAGRGDPAADDYDLYGVYPAIDACVALERTDSSAFERKRFEHAIEAEQEFDYDRR